ncbi:PCYCGC motif-containing (lipo)protein [Cytobacillus sp. Hz8]|uniref:PCYCGC motif-containing (lipo)protein n=1 Tax=Cytobacillus sp. Hz8 TaxID=3347168 RepID=UPI0035DC5D5A
MRKHLLTYFIFIISILFIISGCSSTSNNTSDSPKHSEESSTNEQKLFADSGDLREVTPSENVLPGFLKDSTEGMKNVYLSAAKNKELLESIPCYCGCAESGNHKNNYDCYIYENRKNGEVVWDAHGTGCSTCVETTTESIKQYQAGKSIKEIRQYIDNKYKEGFPKPTPTPMPA